MENFTDEEQKEAKKFIEFYTDLVENHKEMFPYYLSETATLDWFGQTVKGEKKIVMFLKNHASGVKHLFSNPKPVSKIGFRDTHVVDCPQESRKRPMTIKKSPVVTSEELTPPKSNAGSSHVLERGQGDGVHNCDLPMSPAKRSRLGDVVVSETVSYSPVKYVCAEGHVEFHKRSTKKFQREAKWARPCKLEIAYSTTNLEDSTVHLIIYGNSMNCRRNLLKEFESSETGER